MVTNLGPRMLEEDFRAGFKVEHQLKDLRYALETAAAMDLDLPGTMLTEHAFAALTDRGLGAEGTQALIKFVRG
jgi:3-hydroxyisobutyrate dehydrogenase